MRAETATPPSNDVSVNHSTPQSSHMIRTMELQVKSGSLDAVTAFHKTSKVLQTVLAEKVLLERDLEERRASKTAKRGARGRRKITRFPNGHAYSQRYQEEHAVKLTARKEKEKEDRARRSREAHASRKKKKAVLFRISPMGPCLSMYGE